MDQIGSQLEGAGWRQGSIVKPDDTRALMADLDRSHEEEITLLVASHSCDIANNNIQSDLYMELSVARRIPETDGNYTYSKNARLLHTHLTCSILDNGYDPEEVIALKAYEKLCIEKVRFLDIQPDEDRILENSQLNDYVAWLAARYSRPALPTKFNDLIKAADPKDGLRKRAKKVSKQLKGIYVLIQPNREIGENEIYEVNLLGLVPASAAITDDVKEAVQLHAKVLEKAGMEVDHNVKRENEISVAEHRNFIRLNYDDLSLRDGLPPPP